MNGVRSAAEERLDDQELIQRLVAGDEEAFSWLVRQYHPTMCRVAAGYVKDSSVVDEVVQETWLAILKGIKKFEGRSSLKTWMFRILTNRAKTRGVRESRTLPMSALGDEEGGGLDPNRFTSEGRWAQPPVDWGLSPEGLVSNRQLVGVVEGAIASLPDRQRQVMTLRDMKGWSSEEVCNVMEIKQTHQRVLLHRARTAVRAIVEARLKEGS